MTPGTGPKTEHLQQSLLTVRNFIILLVKSILPQLLDKCMFLRIVRENKERVIFTWKDLVDAEKEECSYCQQSLFGH